MKVTQSCPTLFYPMDCIVHGILWARILDQIAFPFSRGSFQPRDWEGIEPRSPALQVDSLPAKPQRNASQNYSEASPHSSQMAITKKSTNNSCWRGYGEKGAFFHCWWECKLIQPLWRTVQRSLHSRVSKCFYCRL